MSRQDLVNAANADEMTRFNARCDSLRKAGTPLTIDAPDSLNHGHVVLYINSSFDLVTHSPKLASFFTSTWAYCNDGRWAALLKRAGIERNPLYR